MPTLYPKEVSVNEANLARLIKTYTQAQESIVNELATATDWGVANRKQLLAQIDAVLEDLNKQTQEWLEKEIPKQYTAGANDAVMQLNNVGADVAVQTGFNRIHKDAIIGLVDETAAAFAQGLTGVSRSGQVLLGKLTREALTQKLAQGIIGGKALKEVRREIKGVLMEQGLGALVDKGGHTWTLDRYADMLFRTKLVETRNRGIANRLVENGYDLVQVSSHGTDHAECAIWEGKILSASGATRGYPTVMEATAAGLFHPNAVLAGSTFATYGELNEMVRADYEGPAITFTTPDGYSLTIGPNHPILTDKGFVRANLITKSHKLAYDTRIITPNSIINSNLKNMPMVEDVFKSLLLMGGNVSKVATTTHDFHGDRVFCKGDVDVIKPTGGLLPVLNPIGIEQFRNDSFMPSDMQTIIHSGDSPRLFNQKSVSLSSPSSMGSRLSSFYKFLHIDRIIHIPCYKTTAYDATTSVGIYNSNGFVVSNCKHAINVLVPKLARLTHAYDPDTPTTVITNV